MSSRDRLLGSRLPLRCVVLSLVSLLASGCTHLPSNQQADPNASFVSLFNGRDLTGWEGNTSLWSVENGEIVGKSPGIKRNEFLASTQRFGDFILKFRFRLVNNPTGDANSGMQFRSERVKDSTEFYGYQADIGQTYWGSLYDESRRRKTLAGPTQQQIEAIIHRDGWNAYVVTCRGPHIVLQLNGVTTVDYTESEPPDKVARIGLLGLQIHAGHPMEIHVKEIALKSLGG